MKDTSQDLLIFRSFFFLRYGYIYHGMLSALAT